MDMISSLLEDIPDPRAANARHRLGDLMLIAVACSLCGGATSVDFAQFATSKRKLLEAVIGPFEPPSHDTFSRLFRRLDPEAFAAAFARFAEAFGAAAGGPRRPGVVAIDGKALRRAHDAGLAASPPLTVTAWAAEARLALAAVTPDAAQGGNEVEAALAVLGLIDIDGATVTADALHCHRRMAAGVRARGGHYALCLKANQSRLKRCAEAALDAAPAAGEAARWAETVETAHGRREIRRARVVPLPGFAETENFPDAAAVIEVVSQRGDGRTHRRLFLTSRIVAPGAALDIVRRHWSIENNLHWTLDVVFGEDGLRSRKDNAPANIALIKRIALNMINAIDDPRTPNRRRLMRCAWEDDYLEAALTQMR